MNIGLKVLRHHLGIARRGDSSRGTRLEREDRDQRHRNRSNNKRHDDNRDEQLYERETGFVASGMTL
jgi:hypothetical protein